MADKTLQASNTFIDLPVAPARKASEYLEAYKGWTYAAVNHLALLFSSIDIKLYKKTRIGRMGEFDIEEVTEHEALSTLHYVNEFMTLQHLMQLYYIHKSLLGESAWVFLRQGKTIREIWPIRPDWLTVKPSKSRFVDQYLYRPGGSLEEVSLNVDDVIFFKDPNATSPYRGYGKVAAVAMQLDIDQFSDETNRNFFYNGAMPSVIVSTEAVADEASKKRMAEGFQSKFAGRSNAHKVMFLDGGSVKVDMLNQTPRELDFVASKTWIRDQILSAFNLSKFDVGILEDVNRASSEEATIRKMKNVIKPALSEFVGWLNEFYLPNFGDESLFFNFEDPVPEDVDSKLRIYESGLKNGWLTINEVRLDQDRPAVPGGDTLFVPSGMKPIAQVIAQDSAPSDVEESEQEEKRGFFDIFKKKEAVKTVYIRPKKSLRLGAPIPVIGIKEIRAKARNAEIKSDIVKFIGKMMENTNVKKGKITAFYTEDQKVAIWKQFVANTTVQESVLAATINDLVLEQEKDVLTRLDKYKSVMENPDIKRKVSTDQLLFSIREYTNRWKRVLGPFFAKLVQSVGDDVLFEFGIARGLDMSNPVVVAFLEKQSLDFIKEVHGTTQTALRDAIAEGIKKKESITEIAARIRTIFEAFPTYRARRIARTEVITANNFATVAAYEQSGVVVAKEWLSARDLRVRRDHKHSPPDGAIVKLNEQFSVGGEKADYPGDPRLSASNRVNCRCTVLPVTLSQLRSINSARARKYGAAVEQVIDDLGHAFFELRQKELDEKLSNAKKTITTTHEEAKKVVDIAKAEAEVIQKATTVQIEAEKGGMLTQLRQKYNEITKLLAKKDAD